MTPGIGQKSTRTEALELRVKKGWNAEQISEELGVDVATVRGYLSSPGRRKVKPKACVTCGAEFQPTTGFQKHCSPACRTEAQMVERICKRCSAKFARPRSTSVRFCSPRCANAAAAENRKGGRGRFGLGSVTKFPQPAVCAGCAQKFMKKSRTVRFCSRTCAMKHRHALAREAAPPPWGLASKGEASCRNCGADASHLHHIVPRSLSPAGRRDLANGLPLCWGCHRGWHDRKVTIFHSILTDEEFQAAVGYATGAHWIEKNYPDRPEVALLRLDELRRGKHYPTRPEALDERLERLAS